MVLGYRVGRVRAIFSIPKRHIQALFPRRAPPEWLAYVELYSKFTQANPIHDLYKITKARAQNGERLVMIIPLESIHCSIHLFPSFGRAAPQHWTSSNVLDLCDRFWVNSFTDRYTYGTVV